MNIDLIKKNIQRDLNQKVAEFMEEDDIVTRFGNPQIAYVDADHKVFDQLFMENYTDHPKKIYRPGKCIITYFLPWAEEVEPGTEAWDRAFTEAMWLSMELNRTIRKDLNAVGRLHSLLCDMMDWNPRQLREEWDFRLTAALGGLGEIGPCGSFRAFNAEPGFSRIGGRCSGIITDGLYAGQLPEDDEGVANRLTDERAEKVLEMARSMNCAKAGTACPGGAIGTDGAIDRAKCQEHCLTINENIPCPDVCGMCYKK